MTKKDYVKIAEVLNDCWKHYENDPESKYFVEILINDFARMLQNDNSRFNWVRFENACKKD